MNHYEWREAYCLRRDIADRVSRMILDRARKACADAGLDPGLLGIHPHNAMCGLRDGKPWAGVNYSKVRLCLWLCERAYAPYRILERWDRRVRSLD